MKALQTEDIFKGAYLLANGCNLLKNYQNAQSKMVFVIEGKDIQEFDLNYRSGCAVVNTLLLRKALNMLRDLIFNNTRLGENNGKEWGGHPSNKKGISRTSGDSRHHHRHDAKNKAISGS